MKFAGRNIYYQNGYPTVLIGGKPYGIHRLVLENMLGRKLKEGELSHHKDEDKDNFSRDNLELQTTSEHAKHHWKPLESGSPPKEELEQKYTLEKNTLKELGEYYDVHPTTVRCWLKKFSIKRNTPPNKEPNIKELQLSLLRLGVQKTAEKYGVVRTTIERWIKKYHLNKRSRKGQKG